MRTSKAGVQPLCKAGCILLWIEFKKIYHAFRNQYYLASCHYHEACDVCHGDGLMEARSLYPQGGFIHGFVPT